MKIDILFLIEILKSLLTPIIGITTVCILILQYKTARQKLKLDLYNKRFETYLTVKKFIALMCIESKCDESKRVAFFGQASQDSFLFEDNIQKYIELLAEKAAKKNQLDKQIQSLIGSNNQCGRESAAKNAEKIDIWFGDQFEKAKELFGEYLKITER
jgi:hypothetical protein